MEQRAFAAEDSFAIMQRAGLAVAKHARQMLGRPLSQRRVLALAGTGNNGGDAFVAAAALQKDGAKVCVLCPSKLPSGGDAAKARALWHGDVLENITHADLPHFDLLIDGLFGIGLSRPPDDDTAARIRQISHIPTLSIDLPSGIDGDSGHAGGAHICARRTVTFFADKPGLHTGSGVHAAGEVFVEPLVPLVPPPADGELIINADTARLRRRRDSHKGNAGQVHIVGGNNGMFGALVLAARAAVRLGAGKTIAHHIAATTAPVVDWQTPEIMWHNAAAASFATPAAILAIGPGLGQDDTAAAALEAALHSSANLVLDADALNLLAARKDLATLLKNRKPSPCILTPHPAEAARLMHSTAADINQNRIAAAQALATMFCAVVVLKGAGSVIADTGGNWAINASGNPGLAQAGAGDVLTGMIAALLAQTGDALYAARNGVWLHGAAADCTRSRSGEIGLALGEIAPFAARLIARANGDIIGASSVSGGRQ